RLDDALLRDCECSGAEFFSRLGDEPDTSRFKCFMIFYFQHGTDDHACMGVMTAGVIRAFYAVHFLIKCIYVSTYTDFRIFLTEGAHITIEPCNIFKSDGVEAFLLQIIKYIIRRFIFLIAQLRILMHMVENFQYLFSSHFKNPSLI